MKKFFLIILLAAVGGAFLWMGFPKQKDKVLPQESQVVDFRASFAIYTDNVRRVFTAAMYHHQSPDVFLASENPNIINVKKPEITWNDFFQTLPFELTKECLTTGDGEKFCASGNRTLKFYLNGEKTDDLLEREIRAGERLLVSFGNQSPEQIKKQIEFAPSVK